VLGRNSPKSPSYLRRSEPWRPRLLRTNTSDARSLRYVIYTAQSRAGRSMRT